MVDLCAGLGRFLAEATLRNNQFPRAGVVREGFSGEVELEPVLKGRELDKQATESYS